MAQNTKKTHENTHRRAATVGGLLIGELDGDLDFDPQIGA